MGCFHQRHPRRRWRRLHASAGWWRIQVQSRIDAYNRFTAILGVNPGGNLSC
jgi:hypothetical protein